MRMLSFPSGQILNYVNTGKFKAPSDDWQHANLYLAEYELFVMTEGTLYLNYNEERFTVERGEYLLLPPCNSWRQGFKPSYCSFYWLHFSTEQTAVFPPPGRILIPCSICPKLMPGHSFASRRPA